MPRKPRQKSETGIYHVMLRGVNRQLIFGDDEDRQCFLDALFRSKTETKCYIYAYCLMDNHIHLLVKENLKEIDRILTIKQCSENITCTVPTIDVIIKKAATSYAMRYNNKYGRIGHLFQDRYKSEVINNVCYFLSCIRYIHQNPLKTGIVKSCDFYWSSYNVLLKALQNISCERQLFTRTLVDAAFISQYFSEDSYVLFMHEQVKDDFTDFDDIRFTDAELMKKIKDFFKIQSIEEFLKLNSIEQAKFFDVVAKNAGFHIAQMARVTGMSTYEIKKIMTLF